MKVFLASLRKISYIINALFVKKIIMGYGYGYEVNEIVVP
ncbi:hypothetical protein ANME2D_01506 [Candidatus Methanoperedens nitroreducens]|uniref:Uncharacterized protein n=1 Tax=Candidatus Methanoperedens nitratireducens TaxID=1392998 RepID=A0A062V8M0_9EURY|nr:hypothetical protein ANME2D_01506 [Candidatus Methanoperedens nitroreducens]